MGWERTSGFLAVIWVLAVLCCKGPDSQVPGQGVLLCWGLGFGSCGNTHCWWPSPKFHICLVLMSALFGHTSPLHIFAYLHWDTKKLLDSCMTGVLCQVLSASPCPVSIFPSTVAGQCWQGKPCVVVPPAPSYPMGCGTQGLLASTLRIFLIRCHSQVWRYQIPSQILIVCYLRHIPSESCFFPAIWTFI